MMARFILARTVDPAEGALQILDFALVINLLALGQFQSFQDVVHFFERVFQVGDDLIDLLDGPGDGRDLGARLALGQGFGLRFPLGSSLRLALRAGFVGARLFSGADNLGRTQWGEFLPGAFRLRGGVGRGRLRFNGRTFRPGLFIWLNGFVLCAG